jgi:hypothetical protein
MRMHAAHMNPSLHIQHGAALADASRRAEEVRRKLLATASELDAVSGADSEWMISMVGGWAGGHPGQSDTASQQPSDTSERSAQVEEVARTPASALVSRWA